MSKTYSKVLPFKDDVRIIDQFKWTPLSVIKPTKESKKNWSDAYLENTEQRRSDTSEYLPGLKFSEFHAGLCENIIHYWSMVGDTIVDPFAGRLTRAFVSGKLGRNYMGYDTAPGTVKKVNDKLNEHGLETSIVLEGDGCEMQHTANESAHLVMTCPPYHDLEKYESAPGQLSDIKDYDKFMERIDVCGKNIMRVLKPGGFCVWVCGDWRDGKEYKTFHSDTMDSFRKSGLLVHDVIIMENLSPFAALQIGKVAAKRYTSKIHEYILVFKKPGELKYSSDQIRLEEDNDLGAFFQ